MPYFQSVEKKDNLFELNVTELNKLAKSLRLTDVKGLKKNDLIHRIFEMNATQEGLVFVSGCLEIVDDGYGFLRFHENNYTPGRNDIYVSSSQIKKFGLKKGHIVSGPARAPKDEEKYFALIRVDSINHEQPKKAREVKYFDRLTPYFPQEKLNLETDEKNVSTRIIDLFKTQILSEVNEVAVQVVSFGLLIYYIFSINSFLSHSKADS